MKTMRIRARLLVSFGSVATLLVASAALSMYLINQVHARLKTVYEDRTVAIQQLAEINYLMLRNRVLVLDAQQNFNPANVDRYGAEVAANVERVGVVWRSYQATWMTEEEKRLADTFISLRAKYVKEGILPAFEAMRSGNLAESLSIYQSKVKSLAPLAQGALDKLIALQADVAKEEYEQASSERLMAFRLTLLVSACGTLAALCMAWMVMRSIANPLRTAAQFAGQIKDGNLRGSLDVSAGDEVGDLSRSLHAMQTSLIALVRGIRGNAQSVATASAEIAQGNSDLSQRTEHHAGALEETVATMNELDVTVQGNAASAVEVKELAVDAARIAKRGREVVGNVVESMRDISAASGRIAEIIGTIDQIAFQTNILALNAAVEAARAGEQGRGFAVVAAEVRSLAQRCASAARDVKTLIGASATSVEKGAVLVEDAGTTMTDLLLAIDGVTRTISGIAESSQDQANGLRQVTEALGQMDRVTQQNAALVEQSAASSESLTQQANLLVESVAKFSI